MSQSLSTPVSQPLFSPVFRAAAQFISYLFHPLFIPLFVAGILLFLHPINSLVLPGPFRFRMMAMVFINTVLFPGLIVGLLAKLGFLKSVQMSTQKERIIPLTAGLLFYFWAFYVSRNVEGIPLGLYHWLFGVFLCSSAAMFINIFRKVSLHAIGAGGFVGFFGWQQVVDPHWPAGLLVPGLLVAGIIGTARLMRGVHEPTDVYVGYLAGIACQIAAGLIVG